MNIDHFPQFGVLEHWGYRNYRVVQIARLLRHVTDQKSCLAFDPLLCAAHFGVEIKETELPAGVSGRLRNDAVCPRIEINRDDHRLRKRYTICHELAHLSFQEEIPATPKERADFDLIQLIPNAQRREESLCNQIAAELLMPTHTFRKIAKTLDANFDGLSALARSFDVSISASLQRVQRLAIWSVGWREWRIREGEVETRRRQNPTIAANIRRSGDKKNVQRQISRLLDKAEYVIREKFLRSDDVPDEKSMRRYQHVLVYGTEVHIARFSNVIHAFLIL